MSVNITMILLRWTKVLDLMLFHGSLPLELNRDLPQWMRLYVLYGLFGLLPTSGENLMLTAPLEKYLQGIMVTCSLLVLPTVLLLLSLYF